MASNKTIATTLAMFAETFPTREVTAQTANVWHTVLSDVSDESLLRAALHICRNPEQRFFPTSGEVFAAIRATTPRRLALMPPVERPTERAMPMLADPNHPRPIAGIVEAVVSEVEGAA